MNQILAEVDSLITMLEAQIPANPHSPDNLKLGDPLEKKLSKYFLDLGNAFPYHRLAGIYNTYVQESLASSTDGLIGPVLARFNFTLKLMIDDHITKVYVQGSAEMISWGKTKGHIPIAFEGPPMSGAIEFAKKRSATLIPELTGTTQELSLIHI